MPNIKSAAKRVRITKKRTERNRHIKSGLRTSIRRYQEALSGADRDAAQARLRMAIVSIDKAVTKGVLHKNTAARKKSRLTKMFNKSVG